MENTVVATKQTYKDLCRQVWHHNRLYYIEHNPEISDEAYDLLLHHIEQIEAQNPEWISAYSPTQRVAESLTSGFKTIAHHIPMLSLANTYSKGEICDFIARIQKLMHNKSLRFSVEIKMDGIAISACYENGCFMRGATRGDGRQGDDITANLRTIANLPLQLCGQNVPKSLELRGEVFMYRDVFERMNEQKIQDGEIEWANPRNAAAGSLKLLNPQEVHSRQLSVAFYGVSEIFSDQLTHQSDILPVLRTFGLPILEHTACCITLDEILNFIATIRALRSSLPYAIDGVVIKVDDLKEQQRLGSTGKHPRWAIAYKFAAEQISSHIKAITVQVGRTGVLTPVAELEPVFLDGSTISRATLHNEEEIQRKDIRVGDVVIIEKGGDVIPKVVSVDLSRRLPTSTAWHMPSTCPACGSIVKRIADEVAVRCSNEKGCIDQLTKRLLHFAGKGAMDIDRMGDSVIEQLVKRGLLKNITDIYALKYEHIAQLPGFKTKSIAKLLQGIEKSKSVTLDRLIFALGIKYVGSGTAELLSKYIGCMENLFEITQKQLLQIDGIGIKVAHEIVEYFQEPSHRDDIKRLLELGISPQLNEKPLFLNHLFQSKNFVITGTLEHYTRSSAASLIKERGGLVSESVTKKTDYVIIGAEPGSKMQKALKMGITMLTEREFIELLAT